MSLPSGWAARGVRSRPIPPEGLPPGPAWFQGREMPVLAVPVSAADLSAEWLTSALAPLSDGARVVELSATRIGLGNVADSIRLVPVWDRPTAGPASLVAKVPATDPVSRAAGFSTRTYELEVAFYNQLAATVWVNRPGCYLARFEPEAGAYVVLLEDLAPAEAGDQIAGCGRGEAIAAVSELAALHAPRWGDPELLDLTWLDRPSAQNAAAMAEGLPLLFAGFTDRYRERLEPGVLELSETVMASLEHYLANRLEPWSVLHGDFRLDNLLFGGPRVAVVDWQTVKIGPPLADVAYFVGSAFQSADRPGVEADLVESYRVALAAAGVEMSTADCWDGYRRYAFDGLIMAIAASMLVARTDRGDDMFMAMANRHGRQALDLGSAEFLS